MLGAQILLLFFLVIFSFGCAHNSSNSLGIIPGKLFQGKNSLFSFKTTYNLKETDPQGNIVNTYHASFGNEQSMRESIFRDFARKRYADAARWGNAYLNHWQGNVTPCHAADMSMIVALSHLYMVQNPSSLETLFINNGHIKAAMDHLQNHHLKEFAAIHCSNDLHRILDRGAYNESALFGFIQGMHNSTTLLEQTPVITPDREIVRTLEAIKREYPKWYEDVEVSPWLRCLAK